QHPTKLPILDLPRDLSSELEVQALVVDRPGLVRLEVDAVIDVCEQVVERPRARLEMEVRHPDERHPAPAVGAHRAALAASNLGGRLARGQKAAEDAGLDDRRPGGRNALVVVAESPE